VGWRSRPFSLFFVGSEGRGENVLPVLHLKQEGPACAGASDPRGTPWGAGKKRQTLRATTPGSSEKDVTCTHREPIRNLRCFKRPKSKAWAPQLLRRPHGLRQVGTIIDGIRFALTGTCLGAEARERKRGDSEKDSTEE